MHIAVSKQRLYAFFKKKYSNKCDRDKFIDHNRPYFEEFLAAFKKKFFTLQLLPFSGLFRPFKMQKGYTRCKKVKSWIKFFFELYEFSKSKVYYLNKTCTRKKFFFIFFVFWISYRLRNFSKKFKSRKSYTGIYIITT